MLREKIVTKYDSGTTIAEISAQFEINRKTVSIIIRVYQALGRIHKLKKRNKISTLLIPELKCSIQNKIDNQCINYPESYSEIAFESGRKYSASTINKGISQFNYTLKNVKNVLKEKTLLVRLRIGIISLFS